jgi:S-adenosylmethionine-diacylglycerol 3-amino-3-carboxypropyl transferase
MLRQHLSPPAAKFWDSSLWMLSRGIYNFGRMGLACRLVRFLLPILGISKRHVEHFFELTSLEQQEAWYRRHAAPKLWGPVIRRLCKSRWFMYLCGVHPHQFDLVHDQHGIYDFVKERIEYVLTKVPIYDNYFLSVTVTGRFRGMRVPPYLLEENFAALRRNLDRVTVVHGWLGPYLDTLPAGSISRFNLLDIFDWMPPPVLEGTWKSVLRAASPGAMMIFRSGPYHMSLPESIEQHLNSDDVRARELLKIDRSATYGGFYIKTLKPGHEHPDIRHAPAQREVGSAVSVG